MVSCVNTHSFGQWLDNKHLFSVGANAVIYCVEWGCGFMGSGAPVASAHRYIHGDVRDPASATCWLGCEACPWVPEILS